MVDVSFNINCREYNERYYTDLSAWKVFTLKEEVTEEPVVADNKFHSANGDSDLPF
jgi:hypothetical protein